MSRIRVCGDCWQPVAACVCPDPEPEAATGDEDGEA